MQLVNQRLREIWPACWPERDLGEMVAQAEARIHAALEAWQLTIDNRFDEGWMAVVLAVRGPTGESLVLKTSPDHPEAYKEALMAEHLPQGPSLRGVRDGGLTLLMQRADPGRPLSGLPLARRVFVCGQLALDIHQVSPPPGLDIWQLKLDEDFKSPGRPLDPQVVSLGQAALGDIFSFESGLCHGDLHADNVLSHQGSWLAIDSKGFEGPLAFECLQPILEFEKLTSLGPHPDPVAGDVEEIISAWIAGSGLPEHQARRGIVARAFHRAFWRVGDSPEVQGEVDRLSELIRRLG